MGATNFGNSIMLKGSMGDAYNELVAEAQYEDGHSAYSGTIQTTSGYVNVTKQAPRYGTKAFRKFEYKVIDEDLFGIGKWDDCACVEISPNTKLFKDWKARRGLKGRKGIRAFYFFGWCAT